MPDKSEGMATQKRGRPWSDSGIVVSLSFLTVAGSIAESHHVCLATRSGVARSNQAWNKTSPVVLPPVSAHGKKRRLTGTPLERVLRVALKG